ncbi:putative peptidase M48 [Helianthus annuus]|uniref:Peptidase M48 n=1 Tax=Helianthus annuus TaxID=4232 RepID=A0A251VIV1_HELAN|nr:mitochondrial metalloendopeptidase OMA1 [Helianthus annuus]KAF5773683.1 putative peptidase M48 [Helianthus annuus]KAJ0481529.1 putative peptidase M48 [Helianthus annuus]KAJ0497979.1 putative peptidase M48 [Helianthus annuus]KAJ0663981.1 putative peptidase M48 [Helianthus annuus]KAJ0849508.1 putative peptidase M48 [Helianthus annuus]
MAFWYRRSKLVFDKSFRSKITTASKPPLSITNNSNQQLRCILNHQPIRVTKKVSSFVDMSSHVAYSGYRCYHVDPRGVKVKVIQKKLEKKALVGVVVFLIGLTIWIVDVETIPYSKRKHFLLMPAVLERVVGENHFKKMKAEFVGKVLPVMHPDFMRVTLVLNRVIQALQIISGLKHLEGLQWEVLVVEDDAAYACCLPGGKIVVFTGLLEQFTTNEELAAIICHEVAHVVARHVAERFTRNFLVTPRLIFYMIFRPDSDSSALDYPFSQMMEIEADSIGLLLMAFAGYNPRVMPKVLEKMDKASANSVFHDYVSKHPMGKIRRELLPAEDKSGGEVDT